MIVTVVATRNRRDMLAECLSAVLSQNLEPDVVIVVDNASADGTGDMIRDEFPDITLLELDEDRGVAGAFTAGMAFALKLGARHIWLLGDAAVAQEDALESLVAVVEGATLVTSRVVWTDGRDHPMNTPRVKPWASAAELAHAARLGCLPIRSASFVSVLVDADAVRERGLPIADYFMRNEDFEFTTRLLRRNVGLLSNESVVTHKTERFAETDLDPGERFYYEVRNKIWLFTRSHGLALWEKPLYGGATLRRWLRTFRRSSDRAVLRRAMRQGIQAGLKTRPRPNEEVLTG